MGERTRLSTGEFGEGTRGGGYSGLLPGIDKGAFITLTKSNDDDPTYYQALFTDIHLFTVLSEVICAFILHALPKMMTQSLCFHGLSTYKLMYVPEIRPKYGDF